MATLNNIIDDNLFIFRSLKVTQSELLQRGQVAYHVHNNRALIVIQDIRKKREISDQFFQTLDCIELEVSDSSDCCTVPSGCKLLKSILPIPDYISEDYFSVKTIQGKPIQLTTQDRTMFNQYRKYVGNDRMSYIKNRHLYIINEEFMRYVSVRNIFTNPMDLASYTSCNGSACITQDTEYPFPADKIPLLNSLILKEFGITYQIKPDNVNDASQDIIGRPQIQTNQPE